MIETGPLWASYAAVMGLWLITVVSPGPNFLATAHAALSRSRRDGVVVATGIAVGTAVWATGSLLGLSILLATASWLHDALRLAGAAYLAWTGARMIAGAVRNQHPTAGATARLKPRPAFRTGLATDLANPKAAAFFTSLFAVALPPGAPLWFQALVVASVVVVAAAWYGSVAMALAAGPVARRYRRAERAITGFAGTLFVGFGVGLAVER